MIEEELEKVRALRAAGREPEYLAAAIDLARRAPASTEAQVEAAYACDRFGDERDAIRYYDAAWGLGVPDDERPRFLVGYGSTLRNVGRSDESVAVLAQAAADYPEDAALRAFLALSLLSAGHPREAVATLLGLLMEIAPPGALRGYERALDFYYRELLDTTT